MNPTDISKILDILVERLGPMGQATWETMLRQVQISAGVHQVWGWLCAGAALIGALLTTWLAIREDHKEYNNDYSLAIFTGCLASIPLVPAAVCLTAAYQRFANPAYYAIQLLLGK